MTENKFKIEPTRPEDLPTLLALYEHARAFMAENGNPTQWINGYPQESLLQADMAAGRSYVCRADGKIVGTFMYFEGIEPTYRKIDGAWTNDRPYGVVHRITSDGSVKGTGGACIDWALERCGNLRIDTHRNNHPMQNLLKKKGFSYCGVVWMEDGSERIAFQKG